MDGVLREGGVDGVLLLVLRGVGGVFWVARAVVVAGRVVRLIVPGNHTK